MTSTADRTCTKAMSSERQIELGWLHFSNSKYRQVKTANGTRHLRVPSDSTFADILSTAQELLFPDGRRGRGVSCN